MRDREAAKGPNEVTTGGPFMVHAIFLSLAAMSAAIAGLVLAATSHDGAWQALGILILMLAWGVMVGYHGRRAERIERTRVGLPGSDPPRPSILTREWTMLQSLAVSILFVLLGLLGLLMAANANDSSTQYMGIGLILLSWFFIVGFHARRAEAEERARHGSTH
jgi:hypothetical protein